MDKIKNADILGEKIHYKISFNKQSAWATT